MNRRDATQWMVWAKLTSWITSLPEPPAIVLQPSQVIARKLVIDAAVRGHEHRHRAGDAGCKARSRCRADRALQHVGVAMHQLEVTHCAMNWMRFW